MPYQSFIAKEFCIAISSRTISSSTVESSRSSTSEMKAIDPCRGDDEDATDTGGYTPGWAAAERTGDPRRVGKASDVYSVGCIIYLLLTGQRYQPGGLFADLDNARCRELVAHDPFLRVFRESALLRRMLSPSADGRPSIQEVARQATPAATAGPRSSVVYAEDAAVSRGTGFCTVTNNSLSSRSPSDPATSDLRWTDPAVPQLHD